jgi:hypothetical protein
MPARFVRSGLLALALAVVFSASSPKYGRLHADAYCWAGWWVQIYQYGHYIGPTISDGFGSSEPDEDSCLNDIRNAYVNDVNAGCTAAGSPPGSIAVVLWWGEFGSVDLTDGRGDANEEDFNCP